MISEPRRRISACSSPTALLAASSERNELEHTSSARPSVRCASVIRPGRISCRMTRTPACATCQAASEPARPAPTICTDSEEVLMPVMGTGLARFSARWNARSDLWLHKSYATGTPVPDTTTPAAVRALSVSTVGWNGSAVIITGRNAGNVRAIKADIGQFAIAKLGQFADIALIVPERLDHADEREQHGSLLEISIQLLKRGFLVGMNIERIPLAQKFRCCGAANHQLHGCGKE